MVVQQLIDKFIKKFILNLLKLPDKKILVNHIDKTWSLD